MQHLDDEAPQVASRRARRLLLMALAPCALATAVGMVLLWPRHQLRPSGQLGPPVQLVDATVTRVRTATCPGGSGRRCAEVTARITSGPDHGHLAVMPDVSFGGSLPSLSAGDKVVLGRTVDPTDGRVDYYFADFQRRVPLEILALVFALFVVGVARWRGMAALFGLGVTWFVLVKFVIPALLAGESPVAVSLVGSAAIMFVVLYLAHGLSARTSTALLGTLASLAVTGALAAVFVAATRLTGLSSEEATYLQTVSGTLPLTGLVLGGIVIGSLGVLNDVTVTQASAVWEIHQADPTQGVGVLYRSGMRVGRDHIASTVYTLVLAYAGASLPLLILFSVAGQRVSNVLTGDLVAEEIVRTLVGSIGLVAAIPLTTGLAASVVSRLGSAPPGEPDPEPGPESDGGDRL